MKLYHGSNIEIDKVDLSKCTPFKDFGRGFYTTKLLKQAQSMAKRKASVGGGKPTVTIFEIPDDLVHNPDLNCRVFEDNPTLEWAIFIQNNRNTKFKDVSSLDCNTDNKYDIVVGPVANDTVGLLVRLFINGTINANYLRQEFDFKRLTNQYTFHTTKALYYLKKVGVIIDN